MSAPPDIPSGRNKQVFIAKTVPNPLIHDMVAENGRNPVFALS